MLCSIILWLKKRTTLRLSACSWPGVVWPWRLARSPAARSLPGGDQRWQTKEEVLVEEYRGIIGILCCVLLSVWASEFAVYSPPAGLGQADIYSSGHLHDSSHHPHHKWVSMLLSAFLIDFSWLFSSKTFASISFPVCISPEKSWHDEWGEKEKKRKRRSRCAVVTISRHLKSSGASSVVFNKMTGSHSYFFPFYFNTGTPGTHKEILFIPMTIKGFLGVSSPPYIALIKQWFCHEKTAASHLLMLFIRQCNVPKLITGWGAGSSGRVCKHCV